MSFTVWKPRSLVGRVALSIALGAFLSGTVVAIVTVVISNRLSHAREDADLHGVAGMLAYALRVKRYDPPHAAWDQTQEHAHAGIAVAVFEGSRRVAGDAAIPLVAPGACTDTALARACSAPAGRWVAIAARDRVLIREQQAASVNAAFVAVILTSLLSIGVALALASAAVKPLHKLARAVQRLPGREGWGPDFGPDVGVQEVDALRATLRSAFERLGRALEQSRRFAGQAAHQLRDPLSTIIVDIDRADALAGDNGRDERTRARRVAARMSTLVDRLLILGSPHDSLASTTEMTLREGVMDAIETLPEAARRRIQCEGGPVHIRTDRALLVSAIGSALENSLKFSAGPVRVQIGESASFAWLAIEDEGPGVAEREREQVFAPFHRGKEGRTGHIPGHGIGLAVIARVVAAHGGTARFAERASGARLEMTFARPSAHPTRNAFDSHFHFWSNRVRGFCAAARGRRRS